MSNRIQLFKENTKFDDDLDIINQVWDFLCGNERTENKLSPNLTEEKAWNIIYYLQEYVPIFPDTIERCNDCGNLFDAEAEGGVSDDDERIYCESCIGDHIIIDDNNEETIK